MQSGLYKCWPSRLQRSGLYVTLCCLAANCQNLLQEAKTCNKNMLQNSQKQKKLAIGNQKQPKMPKVPKNDKIIVKRCQKVAKSSQKLPKAAKSSQKLPEVAKICQKLPKLPKVAQSCQRQPKVTKSCQKQPKVAKSSQNQPKVAKSCQKQ